MMTRIIILSLFAVLFAGCKNCAPEGNNEHDNEPYDVKIQLTAYSNDLEVFAEADPFTVGTSGEVLAHFSFLKNFKPIESGSITTTLLVGTNKVQQTLDQPTRKGIFKFALKPETEGEGQLQFSVKTDSGQYEVIVPNIRVFAEAHAAVLAAEHDVVSKTNTVVFTKEQSWKIDFSTEIPATEAFGQVIKTTAIVQSSPEDEEIISAKTSGIVRFSNSDILAGKSVSSGQNLFVISGDEMADNNSSIRFSEALNNYEKAKTDFDRLTELAKDKIVSEKELLEGKNKYENAKAIYTNLNTHFSSKGQTVKSPISGYVKQLFVTNGQFVEAGNPMVSVTKNRTLLLQADVQQKYASVLGSVNSAIIRLPNETKSYTLEELKGKILSFGRTGNTNNFMIPVNLQITNTGNFTSGSFVEIYLKTMTNATALTIPNLAITEEQGNYFVFVQVNPELFEKREVKIGTTDGMRTEIKSGISSLDRIVCKGAILVKLAQSSGTLDAHSGHVH
jgi:RND family efflux transporter MFP subunit